MSDYLPEDDPGASVVADEATTLPPPDEQLRADRDAIAYPDEVDLVVANTPTPLGRGYAFSPERKSFVLGPQGRGVLQTSGIETLQVWVIKCLNTQRGAHPIYSEDFGVEDPFVLVGMPSMEAAIGEYETMIEDALTYHPRITSVENYRAELNPNGDGVYVSFDVVLDDNSTVGFEDVALGA